MRLEPSARLIVDRWIHESTEALVESFVAINCLINPEAILIGGRLPAALVDRLAASLNRRMTCVRRADSGNRAGGPRPDLGRCTGCRRSHPAVQLSVAADALCAPQTNMSALGAPAGSPRAMAGRRRLPAVVAQRHRSRATAASPRRWMATGMRWRCRAARAFIHARCTHLPRRAAFGWQGDASGHREPWNGLLREALSAPGWIVPHNGRRGRRAAG